MGEFLHPRYSEAVFPSPGTEIPPEAECADCGDTSANAGRFRKAESYEKADEDGEIYECSSCGGQMIVLPATKPSE